MNFEASPDLTKYNGLKIAASAKRLEIVVSIKKLVEALEALGPSEPTHILGDGTNTVWGSSFIDKTVFKIEIPGFDILEENQDSVLIHIGAGENWDECVRRTIKHGLSGIEALSGIPGTVGAGPVQNIGAYGQEISECIETITVFDREERKSKILEKSDCQFSYRDSIFKHNAKNLIITDITLRLSKRDPAIPNYPDVISHFKDRDSNSVRLEEIRTAILGIRAKKLPDPKVIPNCGSFFKNPIIDLEKASQLKEWFPNIPQYTFGDSIKIPAGWLIDSLGMKGQRFGGIEIYKNNALVLTAPESNATIEDVLKARDQITQEVIKTYGIAIEMEPIWVT